MSRNIADLATTVIDEDEDGPDAVSSGRTSVDSADGPGAGERLPGMGEERMPLREGLRRGGMATFIVLVLLNSLDELESAALAVLAPDIADTFGVSDGTMVFLSAAAGAFIVLGSIPMGLLADRVRRGPVIGVASLLFVVMSVLSGLAVNAFMFFWARFGSGIAKSNTGPVHSSMLADTYPIGLRGRIGAATSFAQRAAGAISPLLVGGIAAIAGGAAGWRWAYYIVSLPMLVLAIVAFVLPEPRRGQWEKRDVIGETSTDAEVEPAPISFEAAFARLMSITTLKTLVVGLCALGFGLVTLPVLTNLFLEDRYDLDAAGRGVVGTFPAMAAMLSAPFAGRIYDRLYKSDPARALRLTGALLLPSAVLAPIALFMPNPALHVIFTMPYAVSLFSAFLMIFPLLQSIVPYRLRGVGVALGSVYIFFVGATGGALASLPLTNAYGPRTTILVMFSPAMAVGGWMIVRSARSIRGDLALITAELEEENAERRRRTSDPDSVPALQVNGVDFSYGNVQVLFDVAFEVRRGEVLALLGTNGAGKSTLLRVIGGLGTPSRGVVRLHGQTITFVTPEQRARMGIVSLHGGGGVFSAMSVAANMEMATFLHRHESDGGRARIDRSLALFPVLADRLDQRAGALSGGQQQQLALAMALVHDPQVLLIDELSLGLAPSVVSEMLAVVERLRATGLTMVIVEQSLNVARSISDRAIFLEKGHVRFEGSADELMNRDDLARAVFLGGADVSTNGDGDGARQ